MIHWITFTDNSHPFSVMVLADTLADALAVAASRWPRRLVQQTHTYAHSEFIDARGPRPEDLACGLHS